MLLLRRSQGTQTPKSIYVSPATPCCECSKSPMLERRRAAGAALGNVSGDTKGLSNASSGDTQEQSNTLDRSDIDFIDENAGGGYATVVGRGAATGAALPRISDHTEDEEGSDYEQR